MVQLCHSDATHAPQSIRSGDRIGAARESPWHAPTARLDNRDVFQGSRMSLHTLARAARLFGLMTAVAVGLAACGGGAGLFGGGQQSATSGAAVSNEERTANATFETRQEARATGNRLGDVFARSANPNTTVEVNKYLWAASLDVLNFLPIEQIDPFTGVIVTGYGTPPGSGRAYRATIYVQDPALDARSLRVALQSRGGGAVAPETVRAVEDAILSRARQLRIQDSKL